MLTITPDVDSATLAASLTAVTDALAARPPDPDGRLRWAALTDRGYASGTADPDAHPALLPIPAGATVVALAHTIGADVTVTAGRTVHGHALERATFGTIALDATVAERLAVPLRARIAHLPTT